jgi:tryptophanyl-tRNA synthetase
MRSRKNSPALKVTRREPMVNYISLGIEKEILPYIQKALSKHDSVSWRYGMLAVFYAYEYFNPELLGD